MFSSYGRGRRSELVQAADRFRTPTPLRNHHPTGSTKGCRGAARDILVVALAGHNTLVTASDGSRTLPLVPIVATSYLTDVHETAIGSHRVIARSDGPQSSKRNLPTFTNYAIGPPHRSSRKLPLAPIAA